MSQALKNQYFKKGEWVERGNTETVFDTIKNKNLKKKGFRRYVEMGN